MRFTRLFYSVKPLVPRSVQIALRRGLARRQRKAFADVWPIDARAAVPPADWAGWPSGKKFSLVLTHDVETEKGVRACRPLMELERELGFRSSFNFVPERYAVPADLRRELEDGGFEVGVHGLMHDGKLYDSRAVFKSRAARINGYLRDWKAVGFRSPSMQHNLDWIHDLAIQYDLSTFDVDPFEPQSDGMGTVFPFYRPAPHPGGHSYVEMPYTLPQDFTLFVILQEKTPAVWTEKTDWIASHGGMVLVNVHPDYMAFGKGKHGSEEYPASLYAEFLRHVTLRHEESVWHVLPRAAAAHVRVGKESRQDA
jgi:hypothetical protein